jgi:hypothetical protein
VEQVTLAFEKPHKSTPRPVHDTLSNKTVERQDTYIDFIVEKTVSCKSSPILLTPLHVSSRLFTSELHVSSRLTRQQLHSGSHIGWLSYSRRAQQRAE